MKNLQCVISVSLIADKLFGVGKKKRKKKGNSSGWSVIAANLLNPFLHLWARSHWTTLCSLWDVQVSINGKDWFYLFFFLRTKKKKIINDVKIWNRKIYWRNWRHIFFWGREGGICIKIFVILQSGIFVGNVKCIY